MDEMKVIPRKARFDFFAFPQLREPPANIPHKKRRQARRI
jgi:hypothetical protein